MTEICLRLKRWLFLCLERPDVVVMIDLFTGESVSLPCDIFIKYASKVLEDKKAQRDAVKDLGAGI